LAALHLASFVEGQGVMASKKLEAAISRLADLFEYGHLQASTNPAAFIGQAADEIVSVRVRAEKAEAGLARVTAERDEARRVANAVADEWIGKYDRELERADKAEARLAAVLAECEDIIDSDEHAGKVSMSVRATADSYGQHKAAERIRAAATGG